MSRLLAILTCLMLYALSLRAATNQDEALADSVMSKVISNAKLYQNVVESLETNIYVKGEKFVTKKNFLMRFAHTVFPVERNPSNSLFEMYSNTHFDAPNKYVHDIKAVNGNNRNILKRGRDILSLLCFNVYSPLIYEKEIITPMGSNAFKYYDFNIVETIDTLYTQIYKISFTPVHWSQRLLSGYLYVEKENYIIARIEMSGRSTLSDFKLNLDFDLTKDEFFLPSRADLWVGFGAFKNKIDCHYHASFKYYGIQWREFFVKKKAKLDQTQYLKVSSTDIPIVTDSAYWAIRRDVPLTEREMSIYADTVKVVSKKGRSNINRQYLKMGELLTMPLNSSRNMTQFKYSGIINPFQFSYSGSNGVTYRQKLRITKDYDSGKQLRFRPEVGYMFKSKIFRFSARVDLEYMPQRKGTFSFLVANGNQSYSWEMMENVKQQLKDLGYFVADDLKPFNHYYMEANHSMEITNGLQLGIGLEYHKRISQDKTLGLTMNDFAPSVSLTWTPMQYYWMNGHRKEYLYSKYPTFSVEVSQGIPGILGSSAKYGRVEGAINQSLRVALSSRLGYHISVGTFFNRSAMQFADFTYFAKRYFPESWSDRFGGVFHNLSGRWYNATHKYAQAHFMFDTPFVLLRLMKGSAHKYLISERFYLSQLYMPIMPSYTEIGYGVGSDLFNAALFVGFEKYNYANIGVKFTFELF